MKRLYAIFAILLTLCATPAAAKTHKPVHHNLKVTLYPQENRFAAIDTVTIPGDLQADLRFRLHAGLKPSSPTSGVRIVPENKNAYGDYLESFRATLPPGLSTFTLEYSGVIHHPTEAYGKDYARGIRQTPGLISAEGVYLAGSSLWYPIFGERMVTFNLQVALPAGWNAVSQGKRTLIEKTEDSTLVGWESRLLQEEIYLVAARFIEYTLPAGQLTSMVFLRTPDEDLANKYLEATGRYVTMYEKLIGRYPYTKFALVENFWETGFGMPSFTLLGPKVIRFPFILYSSYPHEILHNWWGNGVFPDYNKGNWSEGLTAYLADHLIKEQRGTATDYRRATLQKYTDYVLSGRDFPLTQFRSRHSSSSEAVGYGKASMFFHMLRRELDDKDFVNALQNFYQANKFQIASFDELQRSFEAVSGKDLSDVFEQWITWTGAPEIRIGRVNVETDASGYILKAFIEQVQPGPAYRLQVPIAVTLEDQGSAYQTAILMDKKRLEWKTHLPARPLRLDVDPEFDLFRRLDRDEIPPALTQTFGAQKLLILLPSSAGEDLLPAYRKFSQAIRRAGSGQVEIRLDSEIEALPPDRAVAILGWENIYGAEIFSALSDYDVNADQQNLRIGRTVIQRENHSVVLTARHPKNRDLSLTWVATDLPEALAGLGRKLPHYHKYSYLGFAGPEPANVVKGRWRILDSPLTVFLPGREDKMSKVEIGKLAQRIPLAKPAPVFSKKRMMDTIRFLSSEELDGRGFGTQGLERAAEFIAAKFQEAGLKPAGDSEGSFYQTWEERGGSPERKVTMRNVVGVIPGKYSEQALGSQSVVLGAHYDHLGLGWPDVRDKNRGKIHPGADDNASGVAVLIELADVLGKSLNPDRSVMFVAFSGEEAGKKGSQHFVTTYKRYPPSQCIGMINLDTVGRLNKQKLLVLGAGTAREWIHILRGAGYVTGVEVVTVNEELDASDHKSFQAIGVPAVQLFSGPHLDYHRPSDTVDKIDAEGLLKVAALTKEIVEYLAGRDAHVTTTLTAGKKEVTAPRTTRKVSLGTIPDFAYSGDGFRISGVVPGSPAELSGLREGDIIFRLGSQTVENLKDLSTSLKALKPGDTIVITFQREGEEKTVKAKVVTR